MFNTQYFMQELFKHYLSQIRASKYKFLDASFKNSHRYLRNWTPLCSLHIKKYYIVNHSRSAYTDFSIYIFL